MENLDDTSEPLYTYSVKPFNNRAEDVYHRDGMVTFYTFDYVLYENYKHGAFTDDNGEVLKPGVYRENELREDGGKNYYTVIVDHEAPLIQPIVEKKVKELNEKYGTDFHPRIITTSYDNLKEAGLVNPDPEVELE